MRRRAGFYVVSLAAMKGRRSAAPLRESATPR